MADRIVGLLDGKAYEYSSVDEALAAVEKWPIERRHRVVWQFYTDHQLEFGQLMHQRVDAGAEARRNAFLYGAIVGVLAATAGAVGFFLLR
jgi:hypothetical protein